MAERFAKVNEQEIRELFDNTKHTVFVYIIKQLYHSLLSYMNSYTTRAYGIIVKDYVVLCLLRRQTIQFTRDLVLTF